MRRRTAIWACASILGCGGSLFNGDFADAGRDASSGGPTTTAGTTVGDVVSSAVTSGAGGTGGTSGTGGAGGVDWGACSGPGECIPLIAGCCGICGMPEIDVYRGVNRTQVPAFGMATCPMPVPCPRCVTLPNPYIGALCAAGRCRPFDVRQAPEFSKCAVDSDCRLRKGLDCCECGSSGQWTAISTIGQMALYSATCGPNSACEDCLPLPPAGARAVCVQGHCEIAN
jgi:hypothetical protein